MTHVEVVLERGSGHKDPTLISILQCSSCTDFLHTFKQFPLLVSKAMSFVNDSHSKRDVTNDIEVTN
jgi:hypothetical protein